MGKSYERKHKGKPTGNWASLYVDAVGRLRSVGRTYDNKEAAEAAWKAMEADVKEGVAIDPDKAKVKFKDFIENVYVVHFQHEKNTLRSYKASFNTSLIPVLGEIPMSSFTANPEIIRKWIALDKQRIITRGAHKGNTVSRASTQNSFVALSSALQLARELNYLKYNPCHGMKPFQKGSHRAKKLRKLSRDKFRPLFEYVSENAATEARLLVETAYGTGARWSEIIAMTPGDVMRDPQGTPYIYIGKAVLYVGGEGENGNCFELRNYTKAGEEDQGRRVPISSYLYKQLRAYILAKGLTADEKLFSQERMLDERWEYEGGKLEVVPSDLGTHLAPNGRYYEHGTTNCYDTAKCRCRWCKAAKAQYRAERRKNGLDRSYAGENNHNIDGWVAYAWFMKNIWNPARAAAGLADDPDATIHKLRHAYISYMLNVKKVELVTVMSRAGHVRYETTARYHHEDEYVDASGVDDEPMPTKPRMAQVVGLEDLADLPEDDDI